MDTTSQVLAPRVTGVGFGARVLGAIGIVFGDIGTSPLYTIREAFSPHYGLQPDVPTVLGIISLVLWALLFVITLKYVAVIMRADNGGEGGIMALSALAGRALRGGSRGAWTVGILGTFGAALFFGDGVLTPAISVLSAIEGLEVATPALSHWVLPLTVAVLLALFAVQRVGTERVGRAFGPIVALWFVALALIGIANIVRNPAVLMALNPWHGVGFFLRHGAGGLLILGAVVLAVTGGETLYADMGHFGRRPIGFAWNLLVLPALALNYLGQGALLLRDPAAVANPFYLGVPQWALLPMVALATAATVIASQAVISGAFSAARQAIQLGYLPRMAIVHTSAATMGQIYIPAINWLLMAATLATVIGFGSSASLATAYGVSVTGTMLITSTLLIVVMRARPAIPVALFWLLAPLFVLIDLAFLGANLVKFMDGAWFPILLAIGVFVLLRAWSRGRRLLQAQWLQEDLGLRGFLASLASQPPVRVPGCAVFLCGQPGVVPRALLHNLKHNKVLHERNLLLNVTTGSTPLVPPGQRLVLEPLGDGFHAAVLRYGFMESPDVPEDLLRCANAGGIALAAGELSFFASRETLLARGRRGMAAWRKRLFILMHRNATPATDFFRIAPSQLVELGAPVEI